jgi:hypothetical protein
VVREDGRDLPEALGARGFEPVRHAQVHGATVLHQERSVRGLLREGVAERVRGPGGSRGRADQVATLELAEIHGDVAVADDGAQHVLVEGPSDHGRRLERPPRALGQPVEPDHDQALDRAGDRHLGLAQPEPVLATFDRAGVDQRPGDLLHEERVPLGPFEDPPADVAGHRDGQEVLDQLPALTVGERFELEQDRPLPELGPDPLLERP